MASGCYVSKAAVLGFALQNEISLYLLALIKIEPKQSQLRVLSIRTGGVSIDGRRCRNISEYKHMQSEA